MLTSTTSRLPLLALGLVALAVLLFAGLNEKHAYGALTGGENIFTSVASSSAHTVGTASGLITASSSARQYLLIVNDGLNPVYLMLNDKPAVVSQGIRLNANGGSYEIDMNNLYKGAIRAIATTSQSIVTFIEK